MRFGNKIVINDPLILKSMGDSLDFVRLESGVVAAINRGRSRVEYSCGSATVSKPRCLCAGPGDDVLLWRPRFGFASAMVFAMIKVDDLEKPLFTDTMLRIPMPYASLFMSSHLDKISFCVTSTKMLRDGLLRGVFMRPTETVPMSFSLYPRNGAMETNCMKSLVTKTKKLGIRLNRFQFIQQLGKELHFGQNLQSVC